MIYHVSNDLITWTPAKNAKVCGHDIQCEHKVITGMHFIYPNGFKWFRRSIVDGFVSSIVETDSKGNEIG